MTPNPLPRRLINTSNNTSRIVDRPHHICESHLRSGDVRGLPTDDIPEQVSSQEYEQTRNYNHLSLDRWRPSTIGSSAGFIRQLMINTSSSKCKSPWSCECHSSIQMTIPLWLHQFLGSLRLSFLSVPGLRRRCNRRSCRTHSKSSVVLSYLLPAWLSSRMIVAEAAYSRRDRPELLLRVPRIIAWWLRRLLVRRGERHRRAQEIVQGRPCITLRRQSYRYYAVAC